MKLFRTNFAEFGKLMTSLLIGYRFELTWLSHNVLTGCAERELGWKRRGRLTPVGPP